METKRAGKWRVKPSLAAPVAGPCLFPTHLAGARQRKVAAGYALAGKAILVLRKAVHLGIFVVEAGRAGPCKERSKVSLPLSPCAAVATQASARTGIVQEPNKKLVVDFVELKGDKGGEAGDREVSKAKVG